MRNQYYDDSDIREVRGAAWKWVLWFMAFLVMVGVVGSLFGIFGSILSAPGRVVSKTLETNNIISNYEFYYDAYNQYKSRVSQVKSYAPMLENAKGDTREYQRTLVDVNGAKQSCRDLVGRYNSNSQKLNTSIFKGWNLPESLDMATCEG